MGIPSFDKMHPKGQLIKKEHIYHGSFLGFQEYTNSILKFFFFYLFRFVKFLPVCIVSGGFYERSSDSSTFPYPTVYWDIIYRILAKPWYLKMKKRHEVKLIENWT